MLLALLHQPSSVVGGVRSGGVHSGGVRSGACTETDINRSAFMAWIDCAI